MARLRQDGGDKSILSCIISMKIIMNPYDIL